MDKIKFITGYLLITFGFIGLPICFYMATIIGNDIMSFFIAFSGFILPSGSLVVGNELLEKLK